MNPVVYANNLEDNFRKRYANSFYSTIELAPGEWTSGTLSKNIALTRALLSRTNIKGKICVDVAAVDGWCPVLMCRRQASYVAAFDRNDFTPLIQKVKQRLNVHFDYFPLTLAQDIPRRAKEAGHYGFDVVVNSGLLYHVLGPLNHLAATRSLVKTGGILILETAIDPIADDYSMSFNNAGRINKVDPTYFWQLSVKMFDYMLRMFRLEPLDVCYVGNRMAVAARAVAEVPAPPNDDWLPRTYAARDILDLTDWSILDVSTEVDYSAPKGLPQMTSRGGVDVYARFKSTGPLPVSDSQVRLGIADLH